MTHIFDINVTEMGLLSNIITSHYYNTLYRITWHSFVKMSTNHAQPWVTPTKKKKHVIFFWRVGGDFPFISKKRSRMSFYPSGWVIISLLSLLIYS